MINNYFLLFHATNYKRDTDTLVLNFLDEDFDSISALILTIKVEKLDSYFELEEFKKLCKRIILNGFLDSSTLYECCYLILKRILSKPELVLKYIQTFEYLHKKELLSIHDKDKLLTIFEPLTKESLHVDKEHNNFIQNKAMLHSSIDKVKELFESKNLLNDLKNLELYIENQTFSIGITGVMNVGKSTLINALLYKELLGTSVVAETANLSVLKYAQKAYTKVRFFNENEFKEMLHTFSDNEEQITYLKSLENTINLEKYIKKESLVIDIERSQLHQYTSASDSSNFCHIVKNVELGVDFEFLKDGIEIVDTPGLDDSLIVRESVTQGYVANCDLLIHLMNVNQSATQKDVNFIIDSIINNKVSKILILLTKADNISNEELKEVIQYTKKSIQNQLLMFGNDSNALKILSSLEFLSVSAKTALDIRKINAQDKQAKSLKNSGILKVEEYLFNTLFSKNSKNEQIIDISLKKLQDIIKSQIKVYHYNLVLYSKDETALENELRKFNKIKDQNSVIYKKIDTDIASEYEAFKDFIATLGVDNDIVSLKSKLLSRVVDEICYTSKKEKVELKESQLKMLIDKSLNHGFIDIIRDYKYTLQKKMQSITTNIELSFSSNNIKIDEVVDDFSMQELFSKNHNSVLNTSSKMILKQSLVLTKSIKLSKISEFKEKYNKVLDEEFVYVKNHVQDILNELNTNILSTFFKTLRQPVLRLEVELKEYEKSLESQIFLLRDKDKNVEDLQINTQSKINDLEIIMESLS